MTVTGVTGAPDAPAQPRWPHRAALAIVAVIAALVAAFHGYRYHPLPAVVAGESLMPLPVYQQYFVTQPGPGQQALPRREHSTAPVVIGSRPLTTLHIRSARVEAMPFGSGWLIHLFGPDVQAVGAATPNGGFTPLVAVIGGTVAAIEPPSAFSDRDADAYLMLRAPATQSEAVSLARNLTTEVTIITENRW
jgi:hypothetical protein